MKINPDADFGKRDCPSCGVEVHANQNFCPICKYEFPHPSNYRNFVLPILALGMVLVLLLILT